MSELSLTFRQRLGWIAHCFKAATQDHHPELERLFGPMIAKDAVIADVGAHAGQFAKLFARLAPQGRVYAFEPSSYALSVLRQALSWNKYHQVSVEPYGLSDAAGSFTLSTPLKRGRAEVGFGLAHFGADNDPREQRVETCFVKALDEVAREKNLTRLDFIKADVEGWEARMLAGGLETVARFKPILFLEVVASSLARAGSKPEDIFAPLEKLGYSARPMRADASLGPAGGFVGDQDYLFEASA
jgi:FkbM family methyltransferase